MNESQMTLGCDWSGHAVSGWLASEKFDGCRAYWDGTSLWTRGGNHVKAPTWFIAGLPAGIPLDGEIWFGRGSFQRARVAVQHGKDWAGVEFCVFDAPDASGTWEQRLAQIGCHANGVVSIVNFQPLAGFHHLVDLLAETLAAGGEGIAVRHPTAVGYERGRTTNLLKVKQGFLDAWR